MKALKALGFFVIVCLAIQTAAAGGNELQKKFSDVAMKVKQIDDPVQKRELLNSTFGGMIQAIQTAENAQYMSAKEAEGLASFRRSLEQKQAELNGSQGYERVADRDLNAFVDYSVQDLEQADQWVYISTGTIILIVLLILLLRA